MSESKYVGKFQVSGKIEQILPEQTFSSGFVKRDIVVQTSKNEQYHSPVKLTFKKDDCAKVDSLNVGDCVNAEGFVEGRSWDGPKGMSYFIDLNVKSIMVTEKATPAEKPTTAKTWDELLKLGAAYGEDKEALVGRCKVYGKAFKEMQESDWVKLAEEVVKAHGGGDSAPAEDDDMPF